MKNIAVLLSSLLSPFFCYAGGVKIINPTTTNDWEEMIQKVGSWLFTIALAVAPAMILIGAFLIITAAGNPSKIATGKRIILYTIAGFAIIMSANGIIALIKLILKG